MKIYLDTSSLIKLYHKEVGTEAIEIVFAKNTITTSFLSEISKVEFNSAIWKKVQTGDLAEAIANSIIELFETDCGKYTFIATDSVVLEQARTLVSKYGYKGLRTLDAIQLSTALALSTMANLFFTDDNLLQTLFVSEGLLHE